MKITGNDVMIKQNLSHDIKRLNRKLNAPLAPDDLESKLLANLENQIAAEQQSNTKQKRQRTWLASSIAASLLMGLVVAFNISLTSSPVELAYAHALEEQQLTGYVDGGYLDWMSSKGISAPVNAKSIVLSKNCSLGEIKAKHLRFEIDTALPTSKETTKSAINMFLLASQDFATSIPDDKGDINGQQWRLYKPSADMEVLVLYDNDSNIKTVDNIVKSMFPQQAQIII